MGRLPIIGLAVWQELRGPPKINAQEENSNNGMKSNTKRRSFLDFILANKERIPNFEKQILKVW